MKLLTDKMIRELCVSPVDSKEWIEQTGWRPMLDPFSEGVSGNGIISYGLSHAGYDLRLDDEVLVFKNSYGEIVDPKKFKDPEYQSKVFDRVTANKEDYSIIIPAYGYVLGRSVEYISMPRDIKGRCVGKSTYARCGIVINTTPLEPAWRGYLTIEIGNSNPCPAKIYAFEGIAQLEFEMLAGVSETDYSGKKYQDQKDVTPARVL